MARICLSEPNPETRDLLAHLVTRLGHDLVDADADVVLVEPVVDGPGAVGFARRASPRARIVICSIAVHDSRQLRELGANAFLLKPFDRVELQAAIDGAHDVDHAAGGSAASSSRSIPGSSGRAKW
ncbi:MAG: hypothetical protein ACSLFR_18670 [Solirubrobacteraceae bacterium]